MLSWRRVAVSFLVLLGLAGAGVYGPTWSAPVASADTDPRVVSKGRYLASVICVECHTQRVEGNPLALDRSKLFAGGERFDLPFGTVYSSNITGMGTMTAAEIKRGIGGKRGDQNRKHDQRVVVSSGDDHEHFQIVRRFRNSTSPSGRG